VQHSDNTPYTCGLSHLPGSAAVIRYETNCSLTKLHVSPVSYRDPRTGSIHHLYPIRGIEQKETAGATAIANWTSRGSSTNGRTAVASCVQKGNTASDWHRFYIYIILCTDYVRFPGNPFSCHAFRWKIKERFVVQGREN